MPSVNVFMLWAVAALFGGRFLVTALPHVHYVWMHHETTEIFDGGHDDSNSNDNVDLDNPVHGVSLWAPYNLPQVDDTSGTMAEAMSNGHRSGDTVLAAAVAVPATVYPHDTSPTPAWGHDTVDATDTVLCPRTMSTSTLLRPQKRNAEPVPDAGATAIPPSIQSLESDEWPGEPTPVPDVLDCGNLGGCPAGYTEYLMMGTCWCRQDVTIVIPDEE
jgi:hypothetical protein